ncbi:MAG: MtrB/PioB family decaheme-associated outer membrane protein [Gammaproteobacteria bacterium]|nr:MtrB/PioB family decaheme-associated outer membrane protein [Gammaproteobacteria bacterium]
MFDVRLTRLRLIPMLTIVSLALFVPLAESASPDTSNWKCRFCPFASGYEGKVTAGGSYVSDDAAKFGNATGYDEKGGYVNLDGEGNYIDEGYRLSWYAEDLGLDSRVLDVEGGRPGEYGFHLGYRELPQRVFDTTSDVFALSGNDNLTLPGSWVPAPLTSGMTALSSSLSSRNIESDRQILEFGANYLPSSRFDLYLDYRRQERDGVDIFGGSTFTQASLLPRPLDYETDELDLGVRYETQRGHLTLGYYGSFFKNKSAALVWDDPFSFDPTTSLAGEDQGRHAQEPDNDFQQVMLSGSYSAALMNTVIAFSAAMGRGEQDDLLLPYTINPNITAAPLSRSTLDAKVDTTNLAFTLVSRPFPKARVKLAVRRDERDNKTSQSQWNRVITDNFATVDNELNIPYSFERTRLNLSADYRLFDTVRVSAGYDRTELDRDFQEVAEQTEDAGWGRVRWRPNAFVEVSARGGASERDINRYDQGIAASFGQNPLMRKYNLAYRYRDFGELTVSASPRELPVSFTFDALYASDDYTHSQLGLTDSDEVRFAADLSWSVSERASVYLTGGIQEIEADQSGSELFSTPDWQASHTDKFGNFGGGFRVAEIGGKVDLQLDYTRAEGNTEINVASGPGGLSQFPDLESTLDSLRLKALYRWSDKLEAILQVRYESFSTEDWALQGVAPDTLPTILSLGAQPYDYDVWLVGIGFRYLMSSSTAK